MNATSKPFTPKKSNISSNKNTRITPQNNINCAKYDKIIDPKNSHNLTIKPKKKKNKKSQNINKSNKNNKLLEQNKKTHETKKDGKIHENTKDQKINITSELGQSVGEIKNNTDKGRILINNENSRVQIYKEFTDLLGVCCDSFCGGEPCDVTDQVLNIMELYRSLTGEYPYDSILYFCVPAFIKYLQIDGIKPEIYEDICKHITTAISEGDNLPYWDILRNSLNKCGKEWSNKELFISTISNNNGAKVLVQASQLGFRDHRFEHAIITLQRFIRYRKQNPLKNFNNRNEWLSNFNKSHHCPQSDWKQHLIHLDSFAETTHRFETSDEDSEISFVRWNRKCIPEFFIEFIKSNKQFYDYEFSFGVSDFVSGGISVPNFDELVKMKRDQLYRKNFEFLMDDDAVAKTGILIRLLANKTLTSFRNPERDILKFINFTLNDPPPKWVEKHYIRDTPIAKCYIDRLNSLGFTDLELIFSILPKCLSSFGRDLLYRFSQIQIDTLDVSLTRQWFLDLVIDSIKDICDFTSNDQKIITCDEKIFNKFLKTKTPERREFDHAIKLAKYYLYNIQRKIINGGVLYDYKIWVEPVKVSPVLLPNQLEAKIGENH